MRGSQSDVDVLVIGAGAAGLAAGHRLSEARVSSLVIEARARIGGRAHSLPTRTGHLVDLGCEWLHSADRNPWSEIAEDMGFAIDRNLPDWGSRIARSRGQAAQQEWARVYAEFDRRCDEAAATADDRPASDLLPPDSRWSALINAISTWANGVELDRLSVQDHARYADSGVNWRLLQGYGRLVAAYGAAVPVRLGTRVQRIDHSRNHIVVATNRGDLRARAVILTVPTTILATEAIRFAPALPDKVAAAQGLPLGAANKLFLALSGPAEQFPIDHHVLGSADRTATGSYQLRPHGWPMISGYFGGELAVALEHDGTAGMTAFALDELARVLGNDIRARLAPLAASSWSSDPLAQGSYSYALPGHAGDRAILARPVDNRLFFAGEACSPNYFSTA
ncbi:MAG TPA: FAD-dependent oxidoreductase, partial [Stellaceae bacterium]|nr:FAD-dependent oxidoreductase [Stellaceae bacterium]